MTKPWRHSHYFRTFRAVELDWYRIAGVFGVTDAALAHAAKKIIFAGERGAKDFRKDINEAIDTLRRRLEILDEDEADSGLSANGLSEAWQRIQDLHNGVLIKDKTQPAGPDPAQWGGRDAYDDKLTRSEVPGQVVTSGTPGYDRDRCRDVVGCRVIRGIPANLLRSHLVVAPARAKELS